MQRVNVNMSCQLCSVDHNSEFW